MNYSLLKSQNDPLHLKFQYIQIIFDQLRESCGAQASASSAQVVGTGQASISAESHRLVRWLPKNGKVSAAMPKINPITKEQFDLLEIQMQKDDDFVPRQIAFAEDKDKNGKDDEYEFRLQKLRAAMKDKKIDVVLLSSPESQCWLHGYQARWYRTGSTTEWPPCNFTAVHVGKSSLIKVFLQDPPRGDIRGPHHTIYGNKEYSDASGKKVQRIDANNLDSDDNGNIYAFVRDDFLVFDSADHKDLVQLTSIAKGFCHFDKPDDPDHSDATLKGVHGFLLGELKRQGWLPDVGAAGKRAKIGIEKWSPRQNAATTADLAELFLSKDYKESFDSLEDISQLLRNVQSIKTPAEIRVMKEAALILDNAFERLRSGDLNVSPKNVNPDHSGDHPKAMRLHKEMTEIQVWAELEWAMAQEGGETAALHNAVSRTRNYCHALSSTRPIGEGPLLLDPCGVKHRYHVNTARQFYIGKSVPAELEAASEIAAGAFDVLDKLVKERLPSSEGLTATDISKELKKYYEDANIWELRDWLGGYQLGIAFTPDWVGEFNWNVGPEEDKKISVDLVTNFESFVGGAGFIDTIRFTNDGIEALSNLPRRIQLIDNPVPDWWEPIKS